MSARPRPRVAVVGHVEWITHGTGLMPAPGEIRYLGDPFDEPGGGGGVSAAQVAKLGAEALFYTALGSDEAGRASAERLGAVGVTVLATVHDGPQTRGVSAVGETADRAILVIGGPSLGAHHGPAALGRPGDLRRRLLHGPRLGDGRGGPPRRAPWS